MYVLSVRQVDQLLDVKSASSVNKSVNSKDQAHQGLLLVILGVRPGVICFETLDEPSDFPSGKNLFNASLLALTYFRLLEFTPFCRDNLHGSIFPKGINQ